MFRASLITHFMSVYLQAEALAISHAESTLEAGVDDGATNLPFSCNERSGKLVVARVGKSEIVTRKMTAKFSSCGCYDKFSQLSRNCVLTSILARMSQDP